MQLGLYLHVNPARGHVFGVQSLRVLLTYPESSQIGVEPSLLIVRIT